MVNRYCSCIIKWQLPNGTYRMVEDVQSFPNPDKDRNATEKCIQRAKNLRDVFNRPQVSMDLLPAQVRVSFGIPSDAEVIVVPTILTQILEEDWDQHRGV